MNNQPQHEHIENIYISLQNELNSLIRSKDEVSRDALRIFYSFYKNQARIDLALRESRTELIMAEALESLFGDVAL